MYQLTIGHLYPDLLNLYGDRGNIAALTNRLLWRGMDAKVVSFELQDDIDFSKLDIVFLGGGSDREQQLVCNRLLEQKDAFTAYVEDGGVTLAVCGGYQLLGRYYQLKEETIPGLSILDITTEAGEGRLIGNVVLSTSLDGRAFQVAGFENHGGRTHIGDHLPFGKVAAGFGNNGEDGTEGVLYKNTIGTYLHGPLLPKNPEVADFLLSRALERKYGARVVLSLLDDTLELEAKGYIVDRFASKA